MRSKTSNMKKNIRNIIKYSKLKFCSEPFCKCNSLSILSKVTHLRDTLSCSYKESNDKYKSIKYFTHRFY